MEITKQEIAQMKQAIAYIKRDLAVGNIEFAIAKLTHSLEPIINNVDANSEIDPQWQAHMEREISIWGAE